MPLSIKAHTVPLGQHYLESHYPDHHVDSDDGSGRPERDKESTSPSRHVVDYFAPSSDSDVMVCDEAYISCSTVVWSRNNQILRSFTVAEDTIPAAEIPTIIEHALFTSFPQSPDPNVEHAAQTRALCVIHTDVLRMYLETGETYTICLSFEVLAVKALSVGLIIQRKLAEFERASAKHGDFDEYSMFGLRNLPILYSLTHPLGELRSVSIVKVLSPASSATWIPGRDATKHHSLSTPVAPSQYLRFSKNTGEAASQEGPGSSQYQGSSGTPFMDPSCLLKAVVTNLSDGLQYVVLYHHNKGHYMYECRTQTEPDPALVVTPKRLPICGMTTSTKTSTANPGAVEAATVVGTKWDISTGIMASPYLTHDSTTATAAAAGISSVNPASANRRQVSLLGSASRRRRSNTAFNSASRSERRVSLFARQVSHDSPGISRSRELPPEAESESPSEIVLVPLSINGKQSQQQQHQNSRSAMDTTPLIMFPTRDWNTTIFEVQGLDLRTIVCFHSAVDTCLRGYALPSGEMCFEVAATSACAIRATRDGANQLDLLYLDTQGQLHLWTGGLEAPIPLRSIDKIPPRSTLESRRGRDVVVVSPPSIKGSEPIQISLLLSPRSHMVRAVLDCLSYCVPRDLYATVRTLFFEGSLGRRATSADEWDNLVRVWTDDSNSSSVDADLAIVRNALAQFDRPVLYGLHLLYLSMWLNKYTSPSDINALVETLAVISVRCGLGLFSDYYRRYHPDCAPAQTSPSALGTSGEQQQQYINPPDLCRWLSAIVKGPANLADADKSPPFPSISSIRQMFKVNNIVPVANADKHLEQLNTFVRVSQVLWSHHRAASGGLAALLPDMIKRGLTWDLLGSLPYGIAVLFLELVKSCQEHPPLDWGPECYLFICREDLALNLCGEVATHLCTPGKSGVDSDIDASAMLAVPKSIPEICNTAINAYHQADPSARTLLGFPVAGEMAAPVDSGLSRVYFSKDLRVEDVTRMVQSSAPTRVKIPADIASSAADEAEQEQLRDEYAVLAANRTFALPVGRAMLTYDSRSLPQYGPMDIVPLDVSFKFSGTKTPVKLNRLRVEPDYFHWPHFHNGVAIALSISQDQVKDIEPSWVLLNRPSLTGVDQRLDHSEMTEEQIDTMINAKACHAGFLLGVGLLTSVGSPLSELKPWQMFEYLTSRHELTSIALLLSQACAHAGTMSPSVAKLLTLHIPALLPAGASDMMLLSRRTQAAAILAMGMLFRGRMHRQMTEVMLREIVTGGQIYFSGHHPERQSSVMSDMASTECHALAAGFALGLITLATGARSSDLADIQLVESLSSCFDFDAARTIGCSPHGDGAAALGFHKCTNDSGLMTENERIGIAGSDHSQSTTLLTTKALVAPGAIMALGLAFLRTDSGLVSSRLAIPDSLELVTSARPFLLMLRTVARSLVTLESVRGTPQWVVSNLPMCLHGAFRNLPASQGGVAGALVKSPGLSALKEFLGLEDLQATVTALPARGRPATAPVLPRESVSLAMRAVLGIISGACFAVGLAYAGTEDAAACRLLLECLDWLMQQSAVSTAASYEARLTRATAGECINAVACAVAMVMAGSGDIEVLRRLRMLHGRVNPDTARYGHHLAWHMAMGLLFLGGGARYTLSRSNEAIAALVIAFYPRFPISSADDQSHLQAWRHMWAMAVQPRCLVVRNIDTGEIFSEKGIEVTTTAGAQRVRLTTPCLMPNLDDMATISVCCDDFGAGALALPGHFAVSFDLGSNPKLRELIKRSRTIFVKSRPLLSSPRTQLPHHLCGLRPSSRTLPAFHDTAFARLDAMARSWLRSVTTNPRHFRLGAYTNCSWTQIRDLALLRHSVDLLLTGYDLATPPAAASIYDDRLSELVWDVWLGIQSDLVEVYRSPEVSQGLQVYWRTGAITMPPSVDAEVAVKVRFAVTLVIDLLRLPTAPDIQTITQNSALRDPSTRLAILAELLPHVPKDLVTLIGDL